MIAFFCEVKIMTKHSKLIIHDREDTNNFDIAISADFFIKGIDVVDNFKYFMDVVEPQKGWGPL